MLAQCHDESESFTRGFRNLPSGNRRPPRLSAAGDRRRVPCLSVFWFSILDVNSLLGGDFGGKIASHQSAWPGACFWTCRGLALLEWNVIDAVMGLFHRSSGAHRVSQSCWGQNIERGLM